MSFRFTFENGIEGNDFVVDVITAAAPTSVITASQVTSVVFDPGGANISFTPGLNNSPIVGAVGIVYYEYQEITPAIPVTDNSYFNWRSANTVLTHPTSGRSFDVWISEGGKNNLIASANTWNAVFDLTGATAYSLNSQKWTVFYDYDVPCAYGWIKGGQLRVTNI